jgi:predicted ArsR family transcriptional regulator
MELDKILLSDEERADIKYHSPAYNTRYAEKARDKAQCLKLLKWLEDEGMLSHWKIVDNEGKHCSKHCPVCELKALLGGE